MSSKAQGSAEGPLLTGDAWPTRNIFNSLRYDARKGARAGDGNPLALVCQTILLGTQGLNFTEAMGNWGTLPGPVVLDDGLYPSLAPTPAQPLDVPK